MTSIGAVEQIARRELGFDGGLFLYQRHAVSSLLDGRDTLVVQPTGGGKSAVYQVAGAQLDGPVVVVSPLQALQRDQAGAIDRTGLGDATVINAATARTPRAKSKALESLTADSFVFLTPEQLRDRRVRSGLAARRPALFVVDEAHCIATWGHQFRPDYLLLGAIREEIGAPTTLALTATATPSVRDEIQRRLGLRDPAVLVGSFHRPELHISVRGVARPRELAATVREAVSRIDGTVLVYVATRRGAEQLAARLDHARRPALAYHAGLDAGARHAVHDRFASDSPCVVVATTAFGMGIDVPHVRGVVHAGAPETLEAYDQEIGRGGRDGEPAQAVLVHVVGRAGERAFSGGVSAVDGEDVLRVLHAVPERGVGTIPGLARALGLGRGAVGQATTLLADEGLARVDAAGRVALGQPADRATEEQVEAACTRLRAGQQARRVQLDRFLEGTTCRWQVLTGWFGEPMAEPCGHCDVCDAGRSRAAGDDLGQVLVHEVFGRGLVVADEGDTLTVSFDDAGVRTLSREVLDESGLVR